jgi:hypothetical protein
MCISLSLAFGLILVSVVPAAQKTPARKASNGTRAPPADADRRRRIPLPDSPVTADMSRLSARTTSTGQRWTPARLNS